MRRLTPLVFLFMGVCLDAAADCPPTAHVQNAPDWFDDVNAALARFNRKIAGKPGQGPKLAAVYGEETRVVINNPVSPWNAIGKLSNGCPGTLVGECLVLIAPHCLDNKSFGTHSALTFTPRFSERSYESAGIVVPDRNWARPTYERKAWENRPENFHKDFAVMKVRGRPGKQFGHLGVKWGWLSGVPIKEVQKFYVAGYSRDFESGELSVDEDAKELMVSSLTQTFIYIADTGGGASGGPILDQESNIIGIHTRAYQNEGEPSKSFKLPETTGLRAMGVPADHFGELILKMRREKCDD